MKNEIRLDFSKYVGTYSIEEAEDMIYQMEKDIEKAKTDVSKISCTLQKEKETYDSFEHNKDVPYIQFEKDNKYKFYMDFSFYKNIPDDVRFYPVRINNNNDSVEFIAVGYGITQSDKEQYGLIGNYGSGCIHVYIDQIPHLMGEIKSKLLSKK